MFWATKCPSSGETTVCMLHLVLHHHHHHHHSSTQNSMYQVSHRYSYFSWWWAHCCPKHVEKRNKRTKKNWAPSWRRLKDHIFLHTVYICIYWSSQHNSQCFAHITLGLHRASPFISTIPILTTHSGSLCWHYGTFCHSCLTPLVLSVIVWHRPVSYWQFAPLCCPEMLVTDRPTPCNTQISEDLAVAVCCSGYQSDEHRGQKCTRVV